MLLHLTQGNCTPPAEVWITPPPLLAAGQEGLVRKYGKSFMRLGWWEMHCAAQSVLPEDVICFDSRFARYGVFHVQHRWNLGTAVPKVWSCRATRSFSALLKLADVKHMFEIELS